jgi:hypothetical protein
VTSLVGLVQAVAGHPGALSPAVARTVYPKCVPETKKKLLERHPALHDLGVADPDPDLRATVAPKISEPAQIELLSHDPDPRVRVALSRNGRRRSIAC